MKPFYVLVLIAFTSGLSSLKAQVWAPNIGTYWYYTDPGNAAFCAQGYAKYDYYKDSLINGNNCQMIRRYRRAACQSGQAAGYGAPIYTYTNTNKVVYVNDVRAGQVSVQSQVFDTLFWFNAPIGAKWQMTHRNSNCTSTNTCIVTVLDTGHTAIQGVNLRWQKVNYVADGGGTVQTVTDTIYERFGYLRTDPLNPDNFCSLIADAQTYRIFRCYGDNQITNLKYRYTGACDYFVDVSVDELSAGGYDLSVFPNPAGSHVSFAYTNPAWKDATIVLQDAFGRTVLKQAFATSLDLSVLAPGMYVITVKNDTALRSFKIIRE